MDKEVLKRIVETTFPKAEVDLGETKNPIVFIWRLKVPVDKFPFSQIQDFLIKMLLFGCPYYLKQISCTFYTAKWDWGIFDFIFDDGKEDSWLLEFFRAYYNKLVDFLRLNKRDISLILEIRDFSRPRMDFRLGIKSSLEDFFWVYSKNRPSFEVLFNLIKYFTLFPRVGKIEIGEDLSVLEKLFGKVE